ncbi:MAG TPA: alpha/beta hydrolase-fold protein [Terriglobales bacterium]|nr:alpha/beta hydrolase-fold protein [Terriglobales bacterium]
MPQIESPEVKPDRTVTFRFYDPGAQKVALSLEGRPEPLPMTQDANGVWEITSQPLEPEIYGYAFIADGVGLADPKNPAHLKFNLLTLSNYVLVPGAMPQPWEVQDIPHGEIHHHFYKSGVVGDNRDYYVYTPPNFNPKSKTRYPVLYLLHGYSDAANGWTEVGKANYILDALIAQGKAKPMIVVMPLGYGAPQVLQLGWQLAGHMELMQENLQKFRQMLITELMPRVESEYPISKKRTDHAIAGLSMGGSETLLTGLNNLDKFAYIGAFSSGGMSGDYSKEFPNLDAKANSQIKQLYIACGTEDRLIEPNRKFKAWLKSKGVNFTDRETPGMHTWMVWRGNLVEFVPELFK